MRQKRAWWPTSRYTPISRNMPCRDSITAGTSHQFCVAFMQSCTTIQEGMLLCAESIATQVCMPSKGTGYRTLLRHIAPPATHSTRYTHIGPLRSYLKPQEMKLQIRPQALSSRMRQAWYRVQTPLKPWEEQKAIPLPAKFLR